MASMAIAWQLPKPDHDGKAYGPIINIVANATMLHLTAHLTSTTAQPCVLYDIVLT